MQYFDLHCDTLYRATVDNSDFKNPNYHISLNQIPEFSIYKQMFAIWIPDEYWGEEATKLFLNAMNKYKELRLKNNLKNCYLAVENASMLNGDVRNLSLLVENNVKYVTLTWNDDNELGSGAMSVCDSGITPFGKDVVKFLNNNNIAVDVSHASDRLFFDVADVCKTPFIATHSNSRALADNKRNLTDEQFKIIRDNGGIVGLNFYKGFLNNNPEKACIDDIVRHAEYFLNMNGEDTVAIGADFDGADMPYDINSISDIPLVYSRFCDEFGAKLTKKLFFDNANLYFTNFDII